MNTENTENAENAAERIEQQAPAAPRLDGTAPTTPLDPAPAQAQAPGPDPAPASAQATAPERPSHRRPWPRTGPIVWGVVVLAICLYSAVQLVAPGSIDSTTVTIAALIGLGLLLVGVSVAMLVRGARERQEEGRRLG